MKMGAEDKKKLTVLCVVGVLALGAAYYIYSQVFASPDVPVAVTAPVVTVAKGPVVKSAPVAAAVPVGNVAKTVGTAPTQLDPTLQMGPMLVTEGLVYTGNGRNIFSANSVAVMLIPKMIAPARPQGPVVPQPVVQQGPPPPPPIDLTFFGTVTSAAGKRRAFLLRGEDVFLASEGDVVQRRYKVGAVSANSVVVEDMTNNNKQSLPLIGR